MTIPTPIDLLAATPFCAGLSPGQLETLAAAGRTRRAARGAFLFLQGDPAAELLVVLSGRARLTQLTLDGQQVLVRFSGPGDVIGALAVTGAVEYPVSAEAVEPITVLAWDGAALAEQMAAAPALAANLLRMMAGRIQELQEQVRELATERVERRIARALLRLVQQTGRRTPEGILLDLPLSRQDVAELTGTTLYTVSRTLSRWEQEGIVASGRERVVVVAPHRLVALADDLPRDPPLDPSR